MRLSEKQRDLLLAVEMQAGEPLTEIARQLRLRHSTANYTFQQLVAAGIIRGRRTYINTFALGYTNYALYFSLAGAMQDRREEVVRSIQEFSSVGWLAEVGARYQYACSLSARHPAEVIHFMDNLSEKFGEVFGERALSIRLALHMFPRRYLSTKKIEVKSFHLGGVPQEIKLTETDEQILNAILLAGFKSNRKLAQELGIHASTFERRVQRLEELGVIVGYFYRMDPTRFGMQQFRIHISGRGNLATLRARLLKFSEKHPKIRKLIECAGSWDFELETNVNEGNEVADIIAELHSEFPGEISRTSSVPVFRQVHTQPFRLFH